MIEKKIIYKKDNPLLINTIEEAIYQSFSQMNYVKFICEDCKKESVKLAISVKGSGSLTCPSCSRKRTFIKRFGTDNPAKTISSKEKSKQTCLERYGTENPAQSDEIKNKIKQKSLDRYGVYSTLQVKEFRDKGKETKKERYGDENYNNYNKAAKTNLERFGVTSPSKNEEIKEKIRLTNIDKYGCSCPLQNEDIRKKSLETLQFHYNEEINNPFQSETIKEKIKETNLRKRNVEFISQDPVIKKKIFAARGQSGPEKKFQEMLINRGFSFESEYNSNGKSFDFGVFNVDGTLNTLVDIDGEYFHGLLGDTDGYHVHGEKDCERFLKVPEGVKFIACDSKNIEEAFSQLCKNFDVDYEDWIKQLIGMCSSGFPYPDYSEERMKSDWKKLCSGVNYNKISSVGQSIVKNYHKSIFSAMVGENKSPIEAWKDKDLLEKCIRNRFIYANELSTQKIADGFNVSKLAPKVSVFRAILAKYLINKYLNDYETVFDPFSGFSGRMLGTCSLGKKYIGQDINEDHIKESNEIINFLSLNAEVNVKDLFDSSEEFDCLFTCPPYGLKETWNKKGQIDLSCDQWIEECLNRFNCKSYLFVVDSTDKYKEFIVEELENRSHLSKNNERVVLINKGSNI